MTTQDESNDLAKIAREWLAAKDCIKQFLREVCPGNNEADNEHNAAALIARLAHLKPPMIIQWIEADRVPRVTPLA